VIDVMDGLAGGVALIAALCFFVVGLGSDNHVMASMAIALTGSIIGFLYHNFPPASIYMGDAGSLFLGFMLAALAVNGQYTATHDIGLLAPILILGIPIFDVLLVMAIRFRRGKPVYFGSPDHFALRLRKLRWSPRRVVLSTYAVAVALGVIALVVMHRPVHIAIMMSGITFLVITGVGIWLVRIQTHPEPQPEGLPVMQKDIRP
jgi:UDP-GlcNAc:undecaprenyl-phosphate GlcNAc-1-phosphate transferase